MLKEPIHSGNITKYSLKCAGIDMANVDVPSYEILVEQIRAGFKKKKQSKNERLDGVLDNIPKGHSVVPVYYKKISKEYTLSTYKEFAIDRKTAHEFLKKIVDGYVSELKTKGLCSFAIDRMSKGLCPFDKHGNPYALNLDHTIERSLAGNASIQKSVDTNLLAEAGEILEINHVNNIKMVNANVEDNFKNELNKLQGLCQLEDNAEGWSLMVVRDHISGASNLIDLPEDKTGKAYTVEMNSKYLFEEFGGIRYLMDELNRTLEKMDKGTTLDNESVNLLGVFNKATAKKDLVNEFSKGLTNLNDQLKFVFENVSKFKDEKKFTQEDAVREFDGVINEVSFRNLENNIQEIGVQTAWKLADSLKEIKRGLSFALPKTKTKAATVLKVK